MNISDFSIAFTIKTADVWQYDRSVIEHIFYYITHIGTIGNLGNLRKIGRVANRGRWWHIEVDGRALTRTKFWCALIYFGGNEPQDYHMTNPHHPTKNHETHKYSRKPYLPLLQKKGFELRSSRADTISAQGKARAINLLHIGSTPHNTLTHYATHTNDKRA